MLRGVGWHGREGKVGSLGIVGAGLTLLLFFVYLDGPVTPGDGAARQTLVQTSPMVGKSREAQAAVHEGLVPVPSTPRQGGVDKKRVLILQTSDEHSVYRQMLDVTAPAHLAYAALHGYGYRRWTGVYKGGEAWLATFNRVYLLQEAYKEARYDWVMYLDPDVVLKDATLSADMYLDEYGDRMLIFPYGSEADPERWWDFNIGFGFYNLRHPDFASLYMGRYAAEVDALVAQLQQSNVTTQDYVSGKYQGPQDQSVLQDLTRSVPNGSALVHKITDSGRFVVHMMRSSGRPPSERLDKLREQRSAFLESFEKAASSMSIRLEAS